MVKFIVSKIKSLFFHIQDLFLTTRSNHRYRILSVEKNDKEEFIADIQLVNKSQHFRMKPEDILSNDAMVDKFSQRDIRTLTYLGYLGINTPKYKILAKRLSMNDKTLVFAIQQRGSKGALILTSQEISSNKAVLEGLDQKDAHMVGYTSAQEMAQTEDFMKKQIVNQHIELSPTDKH